MSYLRYPISHYDTYDAAFVRPSRAEPVCCVCGTPDSLGAVGGAIVCDVHMERLQKLVDVVSSYRTDVQSKRKEACCDTSH